MSLGTIILIVVALALGTGLGYYLRLVISLGKKGSMELEIKRMMITAKEEGQRLLDDAKKKADQRMEELKDEEKKKEVEYKKTEDRFIKKEELLVINKEIALLELGLKHKNNEKEQQEEIIKRLEKEFAKKWILWKKIKYLRLKDYQD